MDIYKELFSLQDKSYKDFHSKLMPTINPDLIIGIRTPVLRKFSKTFAKTKYVTQFLNDLPHKYYEENNLHSFIISDIKDFDQALGATEAFLPYIDNWATCDSFFPKVFKKNPHRLLPYIDKWLKSDRTYTVRFAIGLLMRLFLDESFNEEYPKKISTIHSEEYYINMMVAWYFATALAKQYNSIIPYLAQNKLDVWIHNKTIQKAIESNRITPEIKIYLRTLKIKAQKET